MVWYKPGTWLAFDSDTSESNIAWWKWQMRLHNYTRDDMCIRKCDGQIRVYTVKGIDSSDVPKEWLGRR